ncbi:hypothetical protein HUG17_3155 [Dermatophagoides farinae]|uniref:DUF19 domain-containing protein n=2 Tax=Dermatophagoides farinae TaxID=6954 RepID=A0A9D4NVX9_DERFA|nr:hypothetical protein HUG17_3155 [Dermatophagoides farinae]
MFGYGSNPMNTKFLHHMIIVFMIISFNSSNHQTQAACISNETKSKCSMKYAQQIDLYASRLANVGKRGRFLPTNNAELEQFCNETKNMTISMENFMKQCCERELGHVAKIYLYSLRKNSKLLCSKRNNKRLTMITKLFATAPCINRRIRDFQCLAIFKNQTKHIMQYRDDKEKIRRGCCHYGDWIECEEKFINDLPCINNDQQREFAVDLLRSSRGDTQRFLCGDFDDTSDQCNHLKKLDPLLFDTKMRMDSRLQSLVFIGLHLLETIGKNTK